MPFVYFFLPSRSDLLVEGCEGSPIGDNTVKNVLRFVSEILVKIALKGLSVLLIVRRQISFQVPRFLSPNLGSHLACGDGGLQGILIIVLALLLLLLHVSLDDLVIVLKIFEQLCVVLQIGIYGRFNFLDLFIESGLHQAYHGILVFPFLDDCPPSVYVVYYINEITKISFLRVDLVLVCQAGILVVGAFVMVGRALELLGKKQVHFVILRDVLNL